MTNSVRGALLIALLASGPAGGVQLPPEILLDQLLLRTERLIEADDLDAAVEVMEEASSLAAESELELPPDFRFEQARTAFAVGLLGAAKESVTEYLTVAGREAGVVRRGGGVAGGRGPDSGAARCAGVFTPAGGFGVLDGTHQPFGVLRVEPRPAALRKPRSGRASVRPDSPKVPGH